LPCAVAEGHPQNSDWILLKRKKRKEKRDMFGKFRKIRIKKDE